MQRPCLLVVTRRVEFVDYNKEISGCRSCSRGHLPHEFTCFPDADFANLLALDSTAELFKWPVVNLWNKSIATVLTYSLVTGLPNSLPRQASLPSKLIYPESLALKHQYLSAFHACLPIEFVQLLQLFLSLRPRSKQKLLDQLGRTRVSQPDKTSIRTCQLGIFQVDSSMPLLSPSIYHPSDIHGLARKEQ